MRICASGVRSSCDTLATKSERSRASARSFRNCSSAMNSNAPVRTSVTAYTGSGRGIPPKTSSGATRDSIDVSTTIPRSIPSSTVSRTGGSARSARYACTGVAKIVRPPSVTRMRIASFVTRPSASDGGMSGRVSSTLWKKRRERGAIHFERDDASLADRVDVRASADVHRHALLRRRRIGGDREDLRRHVGRRNQLARRGLAREHPLQDRVRAVEVRLRVGAPRELVGGDASPVADHPLGRGAVVRRGDLRAHGHERGEDEGGDEQRDDEGGAGSVAHGAQQNHAMPLRAQRS